jgi:hypothetical protein
MPAFSCGLPQTAHDPRAVVDEAEHGISRVENEGSAIPSTTAASYVIKTLFPIGGAATGLDSDGPLNLRKIERTTTTTVDRNSDCQL